MNERIAAMAAYVRAGDVVADIGADHGHLPILLYRNAITNRCILTDKNAGPLVKTRESLMRAFPDIVFAREDAAGNTACLIDGDPVFSLRHGDGLAPLAIGEADTVVIAGMGGETIVSILDADIEKAASVGRFILQPRTKADVLRAYINNNKYYVIDETKAPERGRLCEIIVICKCGNECENGGKE